MQRVHLLGLVKIDPRFLGWSLVVMRRLGDPLRWLERGKFFGGCTTVEREGETFVVVSALPASESVSGARVAPAAAGAADRTAPTSRHPCSASASAPDE